MSFSETVNVVNDTTESYAITESFKPLVIQVTDAIRRKEIKIRPEQRFKKRFQVWKSRSKRRQKMSNHFSNQA